MDLQTFKLKDLHPAAYNPRKNLKPGDKEYEKIANSIEAFGFVEPLVVNIRDGKNTVVGGHQRLKVLLQQGVVDTKCVVVDFDEITEKACNVALNKIGGDWEFSALADLLTELNTGAFDMELTGFDEDELQKMMDWTPDGNGTATEDDFDADAEAEAIAEAISKPGDIWLLGKHRVMCGDSTSAEDVEKLMDNKQLRMVWTDPPYGVGYQDNETKESLKARNRRTDGKVVENDSRTEAETETLVKKAIGNMCVKGMDGACCYIACPPGTPLPYFISAMAHSGFTFKHSLVWVKDRFVFGRADYHYRHEMILYGWKPGTHYFVDERTHDSVFEITRPGSSPEHPTMKPVQLIAEMVKNSSKTGDLIADPFLGSGTTLIAAEQLNRICYGMEISPVYCDVIVKRWETLTGNKAELQ
jgi:DNA modification methylase